MTRLALLLAAGLLLAAAGAAAGAPSVVSQIEKMQAMPVDDPAEDRTMNSYLVGFLFNTFGFSFFIYGRKQGRYIIFICGLLLMGYPYLVANTLAIALIGVALTAAPWALKRVGVDW